MEVDAYVSSSSATTYAGDPLDGEVREAEAELAAVDKELQLENTKMKTLMKTAKVWVSLSSSYSGTLRYMTDAREQPPQAGVRP